MTNKAVGTIRSLEGIGYWNFLSTRGQPNSEDIVCRMFYSAVTMEKSLNGATINRESAQRKDEVIFSNLRHHEFSNVDSQTITSSIHPYAVPRRITSMRIAHAVDSTNDEGRQAMAF